GRGDGRQRPRRRPDPRGPRRRDPRRDCRRLLLRHADVRPGADRPCRRRPRRARGCRERRHEPSRLPHRARPGAEARGGRRRRERGRAGPGRRADARAAHRPAGAGVKRILVLAAVALAIGGGTARGDDTMPAAATAVALPSAGVPNLDGALVLAATWLEPPAQPVELTQEQLQGLWESAGAAYGIPWQVLAAINKIESNFGRNMGPSSAGAIGWMQFMPSTWLRWGTDADGNGIADPWNPQD